VDDLREANIEVNSAKTVVYDCQKTLFDINKSVKITKQKSDIN